MSQTHSLQLNGTNQYAQITDAAQTGLDLTTALTIEAHIKPDNVTGFKALVTKYTNTTTGRSWGFYMNGSNLRFRASTNGTYTSSTFREWQTTTAALSASTWQNIAITLDVATETPVFYIDGSTQTFTSVGGGTALGASLYNGTANFIVGSNIISGSATELYGGLIDDVRVFNDVRTSTEINADLAVDIVSDANLVAEFNFDNNYTDNTSNNNDLSGVNTPTFSTDTPYTLSGGAPFRNSNVFATL